MDSRFRENDTLCTVSDQTTRAEAVQRNPDDLATMSPGNKTSLSSHDMLGQSTACLHCTRVSDKMTMLMDVRRRNPRQESINRLMKTLEEAWDR